MNFIFHGYTSFALSADKILKKISPSVVIIKDIGMTGSGVVINKKGWILTNYHVVNTALALKVEAKVKKENKLQDMLFKEVSVERIHPFYDLALVKIKNIEKLKIEFIPAKMSKDKLLVGSACFAVGNPGGENDSVLKNSISNGIISAVNVLVGTEKYIQTTAPINPGNSGGALCNDKGEVIGITTFKIGKNLQRGFAIPLNGFSYKQFVPAAHKNVNVEAIDPLMKQGMHFYLMSGNKQGKLKELYLYLSYLSYREALSHAPKDITTCSNVATVLFKAKQYDYAKCFFQRLVELDKENGRGWFYLADIAEIKGEHQKSIEYYEKALLAKKHPEIKATCANHLGVQAVEHEGSYLKAAFFAKWATLLPSSNKLRSNNIALMGHGLQKLNDAQQKAILALDKKITINDLKRIENLKGRFPPKRNEKKLLSKDVPPKSSLKKAIPQEGIKINYKGKASSVKPAYWGRKLCLFIPANKKILIIDLEKLEIEKSINAISRKILFAAGGKYLIQIDPITKDFEEWDLSCFQKTRSFRLGFQGHITNIEMSLDVGDIAFASYSYLKGSNSHREYGHLLLEDLCVFPFPADSKLFKYRNFNIPIEIRMGTAIDQVIIWTKATNKCSIQSIENKTAYFFNNQIGLPTISPKLKRIYSALGNVYDFTGKKEFTSHPQKLFPIYDSQFFLGIKPTEKPSKMLCVLYDENTYREIQKKEIPLPAQGFFPQSYKAGEMSYDQYIWASSMHNGLIAFIDNRSQAIKVFPLNLPKSNKLLSKSKPLPNAKKSSKTWTKQLSFPKGTIVKIEDAPSDTNYDPKTQMLIRKKTAKATSGDEIILLNIKEPGKEERYLTVPIR